MGVNRGCFTEPSSPEPHLPATDQGTLAPWSEKHGAAFTAAANSVGLKPIRFKKVSTVF